jgi:hypothetical protein
MEPLVPEHAGKMTLYLANLDDQDREQSDNPRAGLIPAGA